MTSAPAQLPPVMAGGPGNASYDENSARQGDAFSELGGPILKHALGHWLQLRRELKAESSQQTVCIADLGSATGKNAVAQMELIMHWLALGSANEPQDEGSNFLCTSERLQGGRAEKLDGDAKSVEEESQIPEIPKIPENSGQEEPEASAKTAEQREVNQSGRSTDASLLKNIGTSALQTSEMKASRGDSHFDPQMVLAFFSDLPDNDWATLMGHIHTASKRPESGGITGLPCRVAAVPGSFYERLFPDAFLDVATTSFSLQWLSRLPPEAEAPGWNPGRIWCYRDAPLHVAEAYRRQRESDLRQFLEHRAAELRPGGLLWVFMPSWDDTTEGCRSDTLVRVLEDAWRELTEEGALESHVIDCFNVPAYYPTVPGVWQAVNESEAFDIHALQYVRSKRGADADQLAGGSEQGPRRSSPPTANQVWAAFQPQVCCHMGTERANRLYERICDNLAQEPGRYPGGMTVLCAALFRK
ncbi:S-adenosyl-L-methionine-dependent methyltransferases [Klebsormidium nitens]|uniref:S-adenosyl-L-methionine-dependent methyltransferases n=1 Tax=Klebsormidium nitens TaxID=105231 RepID=A0A1Y1HKA9_KLENI|nr:S-adenosyl-L-methionine-dependent methyltransferases [Klebsormidium nitens]|eukprot:GAQ79014.1 S-adenosyl-L-methionine-dependent methyltransferases [Klebsormidium nitens]